MNPDALSDTLAATVAPAPVNPDAVPDAIPAAPSMAARRAALIAQCAEQRLQLRALVAPGGAGMVSNLLGGKAKIALAIGGVWLGMLATRPGRAMSMFTAAMSVYKMVRGMMPSRTVK